MKSRLEKQCANQLKSNISQSTHILYQIILARNAIYKITNVLPKYVLLGREETYILDQACDLEYDPAWDEFFIVGFDLIIRPVDKENYVWVFNGIYEGEIF